MSEQQQDFIDAVRESFLPEDKKKLWEDVCRDEAELNRLREDSRRLDALELFLRTGAQQAELANPGKGKCLATFTWDPHSGVSVRDCLDEMRRRLKSGG